VVARADQAAIARDKDFSLAKAAEELGVHRSTLWGSRQRAENATSVEKNLLGGDYLNEAATPSAR